MYESGRLEIDLTLLSMFHGSCITPSFSAVGCWNIDILVPWNEDVDVVAVGLCSILSKAEVVNKSFLKIFGHTTPSALYLPTAASPN